MGVKTMVKPTPEATAVAVELAQFERSLNRRLKPDHRKWLRSFHVSKKGNLTRTGYLTDTLTVGAPSLPFRVIVFKNDSKANEELPWCWSIVLGEEGELDEENRPDYHNERYDNPWEAVLSVKLELDQNNFVVSEGPPVMNALRAKFQKYVKSVGPKP